MVQVSIYLSRFHELPAGNMRQCVDVARMVDDAGIYGIQVADHLLLSEHVEQYPYGTYRHELECPWPDPLITLGAFASATSSVRLSTGILIASLRPAVLLAKQIASLDMLSNGRCEFGLGFGWQREEYVASGLDFGARHRLLEETMEVCRIVWGEQPVSVQTERVRVEKAFVTPTPVQARIPLLLGAKLTPANADLIARLGDGWTPAEALDAVAQGATRLQEAFTKVGRRPEEAIIRVSLPAVYRGDGRLDVPAMLAAVPAAQAAGATIFIIALPPGYGRIYTSMRELGDFISEIGRAVTSR